MSDKALWEKVVLRTRAEALRVRWLYAKDFARAIEKFHGITGEPTPEAALQKLADLSQQMGGEL